METDGLLPVTKKNDFIENGVVVCDSDVIADVGTFSDMKKKYPLAEFIDAHGGVIMPGVELFCNPTQVHKKINELERIVFFDIFA